MAGIQGDFGQACLRSGRQTLDAVMLDRGRLVAESVMRIKRAEISGPDYFPSDPLLQTVPGQAPGGGEVFLCAGIARSSWLGRPSTQSRSSLRGGKRRETTMGAAQYISTNLLTTSAG